NGVKQTAMDFGKKNQLVGVDIGSFAIKVVEIEQTKKGRVLKNFGMIGLPQNAIREGDIVEQEVVAEALKELFKNLKVRNRHVAVALSGYPVIAKRITLPDSGREKVEATIHDQAEQYIPFDIEDVNLDFDILESEETLSEGEGADEEKSQEIMLVAAKKAVIDAYVDLLVAANLSPEVLDVDVFALQNAAELNITGEKEGYAIVNVGAEELGINTVANGASLFSRDSSFGGAQITDLIMRHLDVDFERAEEIKLGAGEEKPWDKSLETSISEVVSDWVQEIKRALDFVETTYPDKTIGKIFICGGACRMEGFQKYLEARVGLPVVELNPFSALIPNRDLFDEAYLNRMAPQACVAMGLALRSIDDK
ncbi:MAG: type IV pilus assembly protein PilM, partial [Deltaproteobacteria bacterium]|nr:type IV pilus assembly protein PilM [Deltaproteobacteria bacterium]